MNGYKTQIFELHDKPGGDVGPRRHSHHLRAGWQNLFCIVRVT